MITLEELKKITFKERLDNVKFRHFLKINANSDDLDARFLRLHNEVMSEFDCSKCLNCCIVYNASFTEEEVLTASKNLKITFEQFVKKYLYREIKDNRYYSRSVPCIFLNKDGSCLIQDCKPRNCANFPYTNKPNMISSLLNTIDIADNCPVVYEILERLKKEYNFDSKNYLFSDEDFNYDEKAPIKDKFPEFIGVDMVKERKLAEEGNVRAMFIYGYYIICQFDAGEIDDVELYQEGINFLKNAAEAGDEDAIYWCEDFYSDDGSSDAFD